MPNTSVRSQPLVTSWLNAIANGTIKPRVNDMHAFTIFYSSLGVEFIVIDGNVRSSGFNMYPLVYMLISLVWSQSMCKLLAHSQGILVSLIEGSMLYTP